MSSNVATKAANQAAEAIRALNYATLPHEGYPGLEFPGDAYEVVASLKILAQRLPQALGQVSQWLEAQYEAGRVAHDSRQDAGPWVGQVAGDLTRAAEAATDLQNALNGAHNASAGLKAAGG